MGTGVANQHEEGAAGGRKVLDCHFGQEHFVNIKIFFNSDGKSIACKTVH